MRRPEDCRLYYESFNHIPETETHLVCVEEKEEIHHFIRYIISIVRRLLFSVAE